MATLIAQQMAKVLSTLVTERNQAAANKSANSGSLQSGSNPPCTFKHFNSFNPAKFFGTEGATGLLQWFESMESTFLNSDCPDNLRVRHASSVLQKRALTWWNGEKRNRGADAAMSLTWEESRS
ncbi:hypothetical protein L1987_83457 [Smallanthus sonchifolius]|uniref:Uncharacterized protein n=1 Tax=Smallanthus sonchifolius TaxID=185202 RepID=A0ACB8YD16_9ASTR|nr:hypothetical protein L1987_83457 [Smallanthus sonchifolius]